MEEGVESGGVEAGKAAERLSEVVKRSPDARSTYSGLKDFAGAFAGKNSDVEDFKKGVTDDDKKAFVDSLRYMVAVGKGIQPNIFNDIQDIVGRGITQEDYDKIAKAEDRNVLAPELQDKAFYVDAKRIASGLLKAPTSSGALKPVEDELNNLKG